MSSSTNLILSIHHWGSLICVPIGLSLNLLLLWLILKKTPKEMWVQSRVLLQTCVLDFVELAMLTAGGYTMSVGQTEGVRVFVFLDGYLIGLFQKLWPGPSALRNLLALSYGLMLSDVLAIGVQFLYRYLVLNHNKKIGIGQYLLLLLPSFLLASTLIGTIPFALEILPNLDNATLENGLAGMVEQKPVYFTIGTNDWTGLWMLVAILSEICFYSLVTFCGIKMVRFVSAHAMTQTLKKLNRQLSKNLVIMVAFPILIISTTFVVILFSGLIGLSDDTTLVLKLCLSPMLHWLPVLNPIVSIWTFRPYRDAIFAAACCKL